MFAKKVFALLLSGMLILSLTACGDSASPSPASAGDSAPPPSTAESTDTAPAADIGISGSLKLALWDKNQEVAITPIVKEWAAAAGIEVSVEVTPWDQYWTMLEASATGGSMPDVFWMHSNQVRRYGRNDLLMDLTDKIAGSTVVDLSKFPADITAIYNIDSKQFSIPKDLDSIALWYNKTMFDEAGVAYPDDTWTWDTLRDAAKKLTKEDGSQFGFVVSGKENQSGYWNFIHQNGGYVINDDRTEGGWTNPKTIEAMEYYTSFVQDGTSPNAVTTAENEVAALLESGIVAMGYQGSWMMGELGNNDYIVANFDCAMMPAANDGTRATIYNGLGWSAAANTSNPDAAWALLEYLGGAEAQTKMSEAGICNISAHADAQAAWGASDPRFNLKDYVSQVQYGVPYATSINTVVWETMTREKVGEMLQLQRPVAEICAEIQAEMTAALAEEKQ